MIVWFDKGPINTLASTTTIKVQLAAIDTIITTLLAAAAQSALSGNMKEYSFDDGMTKTKVEYKDVNAITASIKGLMALQQIYLQMPGMNSRVTRLLDSSNFNNYFGYYN